MPVLEPENIDWVAVAEGDTDIYIERLVVSAVWERWTFLAIVDSILSLKLL